MKISMIAAIGKNRELGKANKLLWNIPEDMQHFRQTTKGHTVIMGRKTFESIGHPVPDRINIIVTSDKNYSAANCMIANSLDEALNATKQQEKEEIFIIGGGQIYSQGIKYADKLYLTVIDTQAEADTFFPDYSEFNKVVSEKPGEYKGLKYKFVELEK